MTYLFGVLVFYLGADVRVEGKVGTKELKILCREGVMCRSCDMRPTSVRQLIADV